MFELLVIVLCIGMNAFLACYETAFVAVSRPLLRILAKEKERKGVRSLLSLKENPEQTLSVIQIGISFVWGFAAAVGGVGAERLLRPIYGDLFGLSNAFAELLAIFTITAPLTYFTVVFGELIPKSIALRKPLNVASRFSSFVQKLIHIFYPIVFLLEYPTKYILRLFPKLITKEKESPNYVLEEFSLMSDSSKEYIFNLFKVEKSNVASVMIPWEEVESLTSENTIDEVEEVIVHSGHTRIPVFKEQKIFGILNSKELFALIKTGKKDWMSIVHPPHFLNDQTPLLAAFRHMQKKRAHMAIARNSDGTNLGIVTMEDIFEEIVGDIYDEDDEGSILRILSKMHPY